MGNRTRRELLADVGRGMLVANLGVGLTTDLGLQLGWAAEEPAMLTFGDLEPLVMFIQDTAPEKLLAATVQKLNAGTELKTIVAAAALANARAFGGEDYIGFHTLMALAPAYHIAMQEADLTRRPLVILKVLMRNATRLKESGNAKSHVLHAPQPASAGTGETLREAVRRCDLPAAEAIFRDIAANPAQQALDQLLVMVDDATEVHRVVLVSRAWDLIDFVGSERAHTLLRQSVHYCVKSEKYPNAAKASKEIRELLPKLLDEKHLIGRSRGTKPVDDAWVLKMSETLFQSSPAQAASAVADAIAEGIAYEAIGESISIAANQLVLRDAGRPTGQTQANKPLGSIHGDSIGVHACDSAHAWRNLTRVGGQRTQVSSLILGAYQVARDRLERGGDFAKWTAYPRAEHRETIVNVPADSLLKSLEDAIRANDQVRAAALMDRFSSPTNDVAAFALFRRYAISEDGALHAEKYYRTVAEEYASARPAFRTNQLIALARVTASAFGQPAPGYADACGELGVKA